MQLVRSRKKKIYAHEKFTTTNLTEKRARLTTCYIKSTLFDCHPISCKFSVSIKQYNASIHHICSVFGSVIIDLKAFICTRLPFFSVMHACCNHMQFSIFHINAKILGCGMQFSPPISTTFKCLIY